MRQRIGNAEIDLLTADELGKAFGDALSDAGLGLQERPRRVRGSASGKTDASGNLDLDVYQAEAGGEVSLARLLVRADNATAGVPITVAAGFLNLLRSGTIIDVFGASKVTGGLIIPLMATWGNHDAPIIRNAEIVQVSLRGYTANMGVQIEIQGWLDRPEI
jgi:hypothetical protein